MSFTFRDRIKIACLVRCIDAGLDEDRMIDSLRSAAHRLRTEGAKTATYRWVSPAARTLAYMALLGIPATALTSAAFGNIVGNAAKSIEVGRLPTTREVQLLDEIATYRRTADEVSRRTEENGQANRKNSQPSARRMF